MIRLGSQENSQGKSQNQRMGSTTTMLHFREQENQEGIYILLAIRKLAELSKNWSTRLVIGGHYFSPAGGKTQYVMRRSGS